MSTRAARAAYWIGPSAFARCEKLVWAKENAAARERKEGEKAGASWAGVFHAGARNKGEKGNGEAGQA
jgi:hypothetical protein